MIGGWINTQSYGCFQAGGTTEYASRYSLRELGKRESFFAYPVKSYGRFEPITQRVFCLTALALRDAGMNYEKGLRLNVGLLATNLHGCAESNLNYFKDYIEGGRTLARANLFIYTLPSSPIAEAAVHFGLQGPLLYQRSSRGGTEGLLSTAQRMIQEGQAEKMLIYYLTETTGCCALIDSTDDCIEELNQWIA